MKKLLFIIPLVFLCGCATLKEVAQDPKGFIKSAQPSIEAGKTVAYNITGNPVLDMLIGIGIGVGGELLRRKYKIRKGSKFTG